jgi:hypothetical protein
MVLAWTIHEYLLRRPILSPAGLFSFGLLDGLPVRLRRPYLREALAVSVSNASRRHSRIIQASTPDALFQGLIVA